MVSSSSSISTSRGLASPEAAAADFGAGALTTTFGFGAAFGFAFDFALPFAAYTGETMSTPLSSDSKSSTAERSKATSSPSRKLFNTEFSCFGVSDTASLG